MIIERVRATTRGAFRATVVRASRLSPPLPLSLSPLTLSSSLAIAYASVLRLRMVARSHFRARVHTRDDLSSLVHASLGSPRFPSKFTSRSA